MIEKQGLTGSGLDNERALAFDCEKALGEVNQEQIYDCSVIHTSSMDTS